MPTSSNISDFLTKVNAHKGFARQNKFNIFMDAPLGLKAEWSSKITDLSYFCDSVTFPPKALSTIEYPTSMYGRIMKVPYTYTLEDVDFAFMVTNDYFIKDFFDAWIDYIIDPKTFILKYKSEYVTDIKIQQIYSDDKTEYIAKEVILYEAYPLSVQAVELSNNNENTVQTMTVTMTYKDIADIGASV